MENKETPEVKLGSDDMIFWQKVIASAEKQAKEFEEAARLQRAVEEMAEKRYKVAQAEFNKE